MTDERRPTESEFEHSERRATVTTTHDDAATAERVAAALRPDNTASMGTGVDGDRVVTTVARESTGGLQSTVDDYVVNTTVAARLSRTERETSTQQTDRETDTQQTDDTQS